MGGDVFAEVNGLQDAVELLVLLSKPGSFQISIRRSPGRSDNWKDMVSSVGEELKKSSGRVWKHEVSSNNDNMPNAFFLPTVSARTAGVEECAICAERVEPDEHVVHLPCSHGYHSACLIQWTQE